MALSSKKQEILFVGDGGESEALTKSFERRGLKPFYLVKSIPVRRRVLSRHLEYASLALKAVRNRHRFSGIVFWQQYVAIYYCLFSIIFQFKQKPVIVYYIIFSRSPNRITNAAKLLAFQWMMKVSYVKKVFFMSESDRLFRSAPPGKAIVMSPLFIKSQFIDENYVEINGLEYIFSGGANNRKYNDIKVLAESMPNENFKVACLPNDAASLGALPPNLEVYTEAYGTVFESLILNSKAVVLPIVDINVASGQLVCLQALQAGRAVFITANNFLCDWIPNVDELDFLVTYETVDELKSILYNITSDQLRSLGHKARKFFFDNFSEEKFVSDMVEDVFTNFRFQ